MIMAFTGHRKINGKYINSPTDALSLFRRLVQAIKNYNIKNGYSVFVSGMALGLDMLAAEAVLHCRDNEEFDVELHCAIPFPDQPKFWRQESKEWYGSLVSRSNHIYTVADNPPANAPKGAFVKLLYDRNTFMVSLATSVLAYYEGGVGGTLHCMKQALLVNKPVLRIDRDLKVTRFTKADIH